MRFRNSKGSAFVVAVMTLFILLALGFAILDMSTSEVKISNNQIKSTQAFYLAEAGISEAINILLGQASYSTNPIVPEKNIGEGSVKVNIQRNGDFVTLNAVGKVGATQRTVVEELEVFEGSFLTNEGIITFSDSNGTICNLKNGSTINGNMLIADDWDINFKKNATVTGITQILERVELPDFPELSEWQLSADSLEEYNGDIVSDGRYIAQDIILKNDVRVDYAYVECTNLTLKGSAYSGITFVVSGSIDIDKDVIMDNVNLISIGDINFEKEATLNKGTIQSSADIKFKKDFTVNEGYILAKGDLDIKGGASIFGGVGAGSITISNKAEITATKNIVSSLPASLKRVIVTKLNWSEGNIN